MAIWDGALTAEHLNVLREKLVPLRDRNGDALTAEHFKLLVEQINRRREDELMRPIWPAVTLTD